MLFTFVSLRISKFEVTNAECNFMLALRTARWRGDGLELWVLSFQKDGGNPAYSSQSLDHEYLRRDEVFYFVMEKSVWNGKK